MIAQHRTKVADAGTMSRHDIVLPASGDAAALLLHGLWSSPTEVHTVARALHRAGLTVEVPIIRGYSFACGQVGCWEEWAESVSEHFLSLKRRYRQVAVGGLCIGSVLALNLAAEHDVAALSLMSTTLRYDGWAIPLWLQMVMPIVHHTPLRNVLAYHEHEPYGLKNKALRQRIAKSMSQSGESAAGPSMIPAKATGEALRLSRVVQRKLPSIKAPALILHAVEDETASLRNARLLETKLGSPVRQLVLLHNSYHIISIDNDRRLVAEKTVSFFREHTGSGEAERACEADCAQAELKLKTHAPEYVAAHA